MHKRKDISSVYLLGYRVVLWIIRTPKHHWLKPDTYSFSSDIKVQIPRLKWDFSIIWTQFASNWLSQWRWWIEYTTLICMDEAPVPTFKFHSTGQRDKEGHVPSLWGHISEVAYFMSTYIPWAELNHIAIPSCKGSWEMSLVWAAMYALNSNN